MKPVRKKLTLDQPAEYCIEVQGLLDTNWSDWTEAATVSVESQGDRPPVTTITVVVDQVGLQGLLNRPVSTEDINPREDVIMVSEPRIHQKFASGRFGLSLSTKTSMDPSR